MNFEKFEQNNSEADVKKELPEVESFSKNTHEKRKGISPLSKYALVALMGYLAGKNLERQIDMAGEIVDNLKPENSLVETKVDASFYSDEFGSFKIPYPEDKSYGESLELVDEILAKDGPELSPENIDKLQSVREALSETLQVLDDVLSDVEGSKK